MCDKGNYLMNGNFYSMIKHCKKVFFFLLHRLIKGTGEVLEEIVSRERHKAINKVRQLLSLKILWAQGKQVIVS